MFSGISWLLQPEIIALTSFSNELVEGACFQYLRAEAAGVLASFAGHSAIRKTPDFASKIPQILDRIPITVQKVCFFKLFCFERLFVLYTVCVDGGF